jgi:hypothetical protein
MEGKFREFFLSLSLDLIFFCTLLADLSTRRLELSKRLVRMKEDTILSSLIFLLCLYQFLQFELFIPGLVPIYTFLAYL